MASTTIQTKEITISLEDLAEHDSLDSLWLAVRGRGKLVFAQFYIAFVSLIVLAVYDLTNFVSDHPGGVEALQSSAGTDGTEAYEYAGHSADNMDKMHQFCIGRLEGSLENVNIASPMTTRQRKSAGSHTQLFSDLRAKLAVTALAACLLVAVFCYRIAPPVLNMVDFQSAKTWSRNVGFAFCAGVAAASSFGFLGFRYLYRVFLSSLDYQNDVFSFPPTIPRRTKRQNRTK